MPNVEVVGIADLVSMAAQERAMQFKIARAYVDVGEMLRELKPVRETLQHQSETHAALCEQTATSVAAILCQKPFAEIWTDGRAIVENVGTRVPFIVHENLSSPWVRAIPTSPTASRELASFPFTPGHPSNNYTGSLCIRRELSSRCSRFSSDPSSSHEQTHSMPPIASGHQP